MSVQKEDIDSDNGTGAPCESALPDRVTEGQQPVPGSYPATAKRGWEVEKTRLLWNVTLDTR